MECETSLVLGPRVLASCLNHCIQHSCIHVMSFKLTLPLPLQPFLQDAIPTPMPPNHGVIVTWLQVACAVQDQCRVLLITCHTVTDDNFVRSSFQFLVWRHMKSRRYYAGIMDWDSNWDWSIEQLTRSNGQRIRIDTPHHRVEF